MDTRTFPHLVTSDTCSPCEAPCDLLVGRGEATSQLGWLLLLRLNLVPDLPIRASRKILLLHQLIVPLVWLAIADLLWVGLANTKDNGPTKRDGNNDSHDGKQKACTDEYTRIGYDDASLR